MSTNPKTPARELALQFLYQCESERLFHFSDAHLQAFLQHHEVPGKLAPLVRDLASGTLGRMLEIDERLQTTSTNWKIDRMSVVDRNILRLAAFELLDGRTPLKVVLNEAVELAKKFGSAESSRFVNGVLDRLAKAKGPGKA